MENNSGLTVQMIVKNEDQWIWYALKSIYAAAREIIIYDTGSVDNTVPIIESFGQEKIRFEKFTLNNSKDLTSLRQRQLAETKSEWFLLVDGDEIWPGKSLTKLIEAINSAGKQINGIVVNSAICLGDVFHLQDGKAGKYNIAGNIGHINIRAYRKSSSYNWTGQYPLEAYVDQNDIPLQNKPEELKFLDVSYHHLRHLPRSSQVKNPKKKLELGKKIDSSMIPEVFYDKTRPKIVPSPFLKFNFFEFIIAAFATPFLYLKRRLFDKA